MKKLTIATLFLAAAMIGLSPRPARAQVQVSVSIDGFHNELAPYGRWVDCRYGSCWVPARVSADWQPYSNGQWAYTDYGWTWISNDPWGGDPYHYGTWVWIDGYGWSWVPGTVWSPAWVTWCYSNNYVGWAPLPPSVVFGVSGYAGRAVVVSRTQYVFVPTNRFVGANVAAVRLPSRQSAEIFRQTRPVTAFTVSGGVVRNVAVPVTTIERAAGRPIEKRSIQSVGTAPRPLSSGTGKLAVVAPARELKAAAHPQTAAHASESSGREVHREASADHVAAKSHVSKPHEPPSETHRVAAQAAPPRSANSAPRPTEPPRQAAALSAHPQPLPAKHAPRPATQEKQKPVEKAKKPEPTR